MHDALIELRTTLSKVTPRITDPGLLMKLSACAITCDRLLRAGDTGPAAEKTLGTWFALGPDGELTNKLPRPGCRVGDRPSTRWENVPGQGRVQTFRAFGQVLQYDQVRRSLGWQPSTRAPAAGLTAEQGGVL